MQEGTKEAKAPQPRCAPPTIRPVTRMLQKSYLRNTAPQPRLTSSSTCPQPSHSLHEPQDFIQADDNASNASEPSELVVTLFLTTHPLFEKSKLVVGAILNTNLPEVNELVIGATINKNYPSSTIDSPNKNHGTVNKRSKGQGVWTEQVAHPTLQ